MSRHTLDELELAGRLQQDAARLGPAEASPFSEALHAKIMETIGREPISAVDVRPVTRHSRRTTLLSIAVAASLLVAIGVWRFGAGARSETAVPAPMIAQIDPPASSDGAVSFDDLNHGAAVALRLVVDQLPMEVPADEWGLPRVE